MFSVLPFIKRVVVFTLGFLSIATDFVLEPEQILSRFLFHYLALTPRFFSNNLIFFLRFCIFFYQKFLQPLNFHFSNYLILQFWFLGTVIFGYLLHSIITLLFSILFHQITLYKLRHFLIVKAVIFIKVGHFIQLIKYRNECTVIKIISTILSKIRIV